MMEASEGWLGSSVPLWDSRYNRDFAVCLPPQRCWHFIAIMCLIGTISLFCSYQVSVVMNTVQTAFTPQSLWDLASNRAICDNFTFPQSMGINPNEHHLFWVLPNKWYENPAWNDHSDVCTISCSNMWFESFTIMEITGLQGQRSQRWLEADGINTGAWKGGKTEEQVCSFQMAVMSFCTGKQETAYRYSFTSLWC